MEHPGHLGDAQPHLFQLVPVLKHLTGGTLEGDGPVVDDHQPVHSAGHVLHGVGHQDNGGVVGLVVVPDILQDGFHSLRV